MRCTIFIVLLVSLAGCGGDATLDAFERLEQATSAGGAVSHGPTVLTTQIIDDLEDGDRRLTETSNGWWYAYNDGTDQQQIDVVSNQAERPNSSFAVYTSGGRFTAWGAGLGVGLIGLSDPDLPDEPLDASGYAGFSFWAKIGESTARELRVDLLSPCGSTCTTHYGSTLRLAPEWRHYTLLFSDVERTSADGASLDPSALTHLQFFWAVPDGFELWVDDLALVAPASP